MNTVVVWLLISVGSHGGEVSRPGNLIERFATRDDCIRVMDHLNTNHLNRVHTCVDARIALIPSR